MLLYHPEASPNEAVGAIVIGGAFHWQFRSLHFHLLMVHYGVITARWEHPQTGRNYRNRPILCPQSVDHPNGSVVLHPL